MDSKHGDPDTAGKCQVNMWDSILKPIKVAKMKNSDNTQCWWWYRTEIYIILCRWKGKLL